MESKDEKREQRTQLCINVVLWITAAAALLLAVKIIVERGVL